MVFLRSLKDPCSEIYVCKLHVTGSHIINSFRLVIESNSFEKLSILHSHHPPFSSVSKD